MAIAEPLPRSTPITPKEAIIRRVASIPDEVIDIVNEQIVKNLQTSQGAANCQAKAKVLLKDITREILKDSNLCDILHRTYPEVSLERALTLIGWLDFEPRFKLSGWTVAYRSPSIGDSFDAHFIFEG